LGVPELPDIEVYVDALTRYVVGHRIVAVRIKSPSLLRTFEPPVESLVGKRVTDISRLGKRVVIECEDNLMVVMHLMIAGRLLWKPPVTLPKGKIDQAAIEFEAGTIMLTEASQQKRTSMHVVRGRAALASMDPGGADPMNCSPEDFKKVLTTQNRTLKRALTDPSVFSGIGNAYSDEILYDAKLSPVKLTASLQEEEIARLMLATRRILSHWIVALKQEYAGRFPKAGEITAFRPEFRVHGKFGERCSICGKNIQRIIRGDRETNYCPGCQTGGKILADRSLSRLLGKDWPRTSAEWEAMETKLREES
jgi:formamidopyrimidine-DNA glycosylase